jgi:hypothetical protein
MKVDIHVLNFKFQNKKYKEKITINVGRFFRGRGKEALKES